MKKKEEKKVESRDFKVGAIHPVGSPASSQSCFLRPPTPAIGPTSEITPVDWTSSRSWADFLGCTRFSYIVRGDRQSERE